MSEMGKVKANHPLAEIIAKKLFGIEGVPKEEQRRMVNRAAMAAVEFYEQCKAERDAYREGWITHISCGQEKFRTVAEEVVEMGAQRILSAPQSQDGRGRKES